ncbi:hypothetical protein J7E79_02820 [Bacillus sp. ISL-40]|uniref:hypothetical protein n=1 Tax=unclassified Bacillus (in: firmicutes) TaxID=185979 RepID=UPI001BE9CAD8|nr:MULTISPECIES: hypothetical protein [unclassified Bacillus (in: firmicutes)]MBT2696369.1 hypothetical protein [Bacillus sp. ISL-40]MBT2743217.1 hypothetical protein [Bacillus sp. ISL-77]
MRENDSSVDMDKLHEFFMAGEKIAVIAFKFGVSEGYIQQIISKERKLIPEKWPKRQKPIPELQEIKENLEAIQMQYDTQGYVSTNDADDLVRYCKVLIKMVEQSRPGPKKASYMDLDDE